MAGLLVLIGVFVALVADSPEAGIMFAASAILIHPGKEPDGKPRERS